MGRGVKVLSSLIVAFLLLVGAALFWVAYAPALDPLEPGSLEFSDDEIERGELLALVGACSACHTAEGGAPLAGGLGLPTPFGTIYSTNITPDPETGIGRWSLAAFARAMREGLDREGRHLYPAFPYDSFTKSTDEDLRAIYAWLMSQPPVIAARTPNELPFPFSFRPVLAGWKLLFLDGTPYVPDPALNEELNRGAYLAMSLGHCGACHTPRNRFGAMIVDRLFEGGEAEGWLAPPLGDHSIAPVSWTLNDYADYLFDGWSEEHGIAAGPMATVADQLYDADEDDVFAIAAWLESITPEQSDEDRSAALRFAKARDWPPTEGVHYDEKITDPVLSAGRDVFAARCAKCHKERIARSQAISLGLTYAINAPSPKNLFNVVRGGIAPPLGVPDRKMEAIALTDEELSNVAAYVRWHFTDRPPWSDLERAAASH